MPEFDFGRQFVSLGFALSSRGGGNRLVAGIAILHNHLPLAPYILFHVLGGLLSQVVLVQVKTGNHATHSIFGHL